MQNIYICVCMIEGVRCRVSCAGFSSVTGNAYVSMSYRWFNEYKLSFLFGVGAFFVEQLRWAHECARAHSI